ncbi:cytochrome b [Mesorhizobium sp. ZMM04-5]|uniref:Cytochrome b n=1 Tax=Mesorhizobium marinum TaxID=3228790 RepID=A0ABV3R1K8_9HYPH
MSRGTAYDPVSIAFHWTIAALFLGQMALGLSMERVKSMALQFELIQWHKSFGFLILVLASLRLGWRIAAGAPAPDAGLGAVERRAAALVQGALLALTLMVPAAGWALASTSTLGIPSFAFNLVIVPPLPLTPSAPAEAFWRQAHKLLAYAALALVAGHAAAALRHHLLLRDAVLARMLPGLSPRPAKPGDPQPSRRTSRDA